MVVKNPAKSIFDIAKIIVRDSPDTTPKEALRLAQYFYKNRHQYKMTAPKTTIDCANAGGG
jgi:hypothetical protein